MSCSREQIQRSATEKKLTSSGPEESQFWMQIQQEAAPAPFCMSAPSRSSTRKATKNPWPRFCVVTAEPTRCSQLQLLCVHEEMRHRSKSGKQRKYGQRKKERERERHRHTHTHTHIYRQRLQRDRPLPVHTYIYIYIYLYINVNAYIYIYIYMYIYI